MPVNRDKYFEYDKYFIAKNLYDKYFEYDKYFGKLPEVSEPTPVKIEVIQTKPAVAMKWPEGTPTPGITIQEPMITLRESNERVKGAYQTAIHYLLLEIETYKKEASAVNIFDNLRLVKIGQKKVLQKAADHLYMLLHGHYPID